MNFEWDENKNRQNIAKHGIDFELASHIFNGPTVSKVDDRVDYGEERIISIGAINDAVILVVVHTQREINTVRIISARKANRSERRRYEEKVQ